MQKSARMLQAGTQRAARGVDERTIRPPDLSLLLPKYSL
jgi:hypothetical protein